MAQRIRSGVVPFVLAVVLLSLAPLAEAVDGVVLIDQNRALAGNVTPGDLPGFPVTISRPGSYRLSGNLDIADPDASAIEITSNNVTVDLNGFVIQGPLDQCAGSFVPVWCQNQLRGEASRLISPEAATYTCVRRTSPFSTEPFARWAISACYWAFGPRWHV